MDMSIGAEYIIANAIIALKNNKNRQVTFAEIRDIGNRVQQSCNEQGIDAIINSYGHDITAAVLDFSNYFEFTDNRNSGAAPKIRLKMGIPADSLKQRFVDYLPSRIGDIITAETLKVVGNTI